MLPALITLAGGGGFDLAALLKAELKRAGSPLARDRVLDFELALYDTQPAAIVGLDETFIASARLDNLLSCHTALEALIDAPPAPNSSSPTITRKWAAVRLRRCQGTFLRSVLERLAGGDEVRAYRRPFAAGLDGQRARLAPQLPSATTNATGRA